MKKENFGYVVFLSVVAAIGGILFGYDTAVISGTTSIVATQFGLDTIQLGWYVGCALIGSIAVSLRLVSSVTVSAVKSQCCLRHSCSAFQQ